MATLPSSNRPRRSVLLTAGIAFALVFATLSSQDVSLLRGQLTGGGSSASCESCDECGAGLINMCDEAECERMGSGCAYEPYTFLGISLGFGSCDAGPQCGTRFAARDIDIDDLTCDPIYEKLDTLSFTADDGLDDPFVVDQEGLDGMSALTLSFCGEGTGIAISKAYETNSDGAYHFEVNANHFSGGSYQHTWRVNEDERSSGGGTTNWVTSERLIDDQGLHEELHHYSAVYDSFPDPPSWVFPVLRAYRDGAPLMALPRPSGSATQPHGGPLPSLPTMKFVIGGTNGWGGSSNTTAVWQEERFEGDISKVRVYDCALTAEEISALAKDCVGDPEENDALFVHAEDPPHRGRMITYGEEEYKHIGGKDYELNTVFSVTFTASGDAVNIGYLALSISGTILKSVEGIKLYDVASFTDPKKSGLQVPAVRAEAKEYYCDSTIPLEAPDGTPLQTFCARNFFDSPIFLTVPAGETKTLYGVLDWSSQLLDRDIPDDPEHFRILLVTADGAQPVEAVGLRANDGDGVAEGEVIIGRQDVGPDIDIVTPKHMLSKLRLGLVSNGNYTCERIAEGPSRIGSFAFEEQTGLDRYGVFSRALGTHTKTLEINDLIFTVDARNVELDEDSFTLGISTEYDSTLSAEDVLENRSQHTECEAEEDGDLYRVICKGIDEFTGQCLSGTYAPIDCTTLNAQLDPYDYDLFVDVLDASVDDDENSVIQSRLEGYSDDEAEEVGIEEGESHIRWTYPTRTNSADPLVLYWLDNRAEELYDAFLFGTVDQVLDPPEGVFCSTGGSECALEYDDVNDQMPVYSSLCEDSGGTCEPTVGLICDNNAFRTDDDEGYINPSLRPKHGMICNTLEDMEACVEAGGFCKAAENWRCNPVEGAADPGDCADQEGYEACGGECLVLGTMVCTGGSRDGDACDSDASVAACVEGDGACTPTQADICVGGTNDGGLCYRSESNRETCQDNGGACVPSIDIIPSSVARCQGGPDAGQECLTTFGHCAGDGICEWEWNSVECRGFPEGTIDYHLPEGTACHQTEGVNGHITLCEDSGRKCIVADDYPLFGQSFCTAGSAYGDACDTLATFHACTNGGGTCDMRGLRRCEHPTDTVNGSVNTEYPVALDPYYCHDEDSISDCVNAGGVCVTIGVDPAGGTTVCTEREEASSSSSEASCGTIAAPPTDQCAPTLKLKEQQTYPDATETYDLGNAVLRTATYMTCFQPFTTYGDEYASHQFTYDDSAWFGVRTSGVAPYGDPFPVFNIALALSNPSPGSENHFLSHYGTAMEMPTTKWTHVAATYDANNKHTVTFYQNGEETVEANGLNNRNPDMYEGLRAPGEVVVGSSTTASSNFTFQGLRRETRIYPCVLSEESIKHYATACEDGVDPDLRLDQVPCPESAASEDSSEDESEESSDASSQESEDSDQCDCTINILNCNFSDAQEQADCLEERCLDSGPFCAWQPYDDSTPAPGDSFLANHPVLNVFYSCQADTECQESSSSEASTHPSAPECYDADGGLNYEEQGETYIAEACEEELAWWSPRAWMAALLSLFDTEPSSENLTANVTACDAPTNMHIEEMSCCLEDSTLGEYECFFTIANKGPNLSASYQLDLLTYTHPPGEEDNVSSYRLRDTFLVSSGDIPFNGGTVATIGSMTTGQGENDTAQFQTPEVPAGDVITGTVRVRIQTDDVVQFAVNMEAVPAIGRVSPFSDSSTVRVLAQSDCSDPVPEPVSDIQSYGTMVRNTEDVCGPFVPPAEETVTTFRAAPTAFDEEENSCEPEPVDPDDVFEDFCLDEETVVEYYCDDDGSVAEEQRECEDDEICLEGACVQVGTCDDCERCGEGFGNTCDADECARLGPCIFEDDALANICDPDPDECGESVSSDPAECPDPCGNGYCDTDWGETVDNCPEDCSGDCETVFIPEQCDDGNTDPHDGCNELCQECEGESSSEPALLICCVDDECVLTEECDAPLVAYDDINECFDACAPLSSSSDSDASSADSESSSSGDSESSSSGDSDSSSSADSSSSTSDSASDSSSSLSPFLSSESSSDGEVASSSSSSEVSIFLSSASSSSFVDPCGNGVFDAGEQCDVGVETCLPGRVCDLDICTCYPEDPLPACDGVELNKDQGEQCDGDSGCEDDRVCDLETCTCVPEGTESPECGDGVTSGAEECDDGNLVDADGCTSICTLEKDSPITSLPVCGNGILEAPEECDDRNTESGDGCSSRCEIEAGQTTACGDGILTVGEECDDGNTSSDDGCSSACLLEIGCEDDDDCSIGACTSGSCTPCEDNDECGVGICDDTERCTGLPLVGAATVCGNGVLEPPEECDDSNDRDSDGCSSACLLEIGICGDGIVQSLLGEQCESSSHDPTLPYDCVSCRFYSDSCGDGIIDRGEECDDGPLNSTSPDAFCRPDCSVGRCGDSILDSVEECDDGNLINGDGCEDTCRKGTVVAGIAFPYGARYGFPSAPTYQSLPYQLPLTRLQPLIQQQAPAGDTGPAAVFVVGAGAAAGVAWIRRRRK